MNFKSTKPIEAESDSSRSLIARASQIMAFIIGLGLISMISSMLVAESLSGDADQINRAGSLRMLAVKVSRAILQENQLLESKTDETTTSIANKVIEAHNEFDVAFSHLFDGGLTDELDNLQIKNQFQLISKQWAQIKNKKISINVAIFDQFVTELDQLVLLIQRESERKISLMRAIQGISLFLVIIIAFVVLVRINRTIIAPLKKLIRVAEAAGRGNFDIVSEYDEKNELGLLSQTINNMSQELKLTHQNFEQRVTEKTSALAYAMEQERIAENRLVIIEERAVIARELHDSLAQSLSYINIQVALLKKKMDKQLPQREIDLTVEDIRVGNNRAYLHLRELLTTFRLKLDDPSLESALSGTAAEFSSKSGHPITLDFEMHDQSLSANQEIHILQIVREALSNIQRHAKATNARIYFYADAKKCTVTIEDDGVGMELQEGHDGRDDHFGLGIMKERAKSLNAEFSFESSVGKGTKVKLNMAL